MNLKKLPLAVIIASLVSLPVLAQTQNTSGSDVTLTKSVDVSKEVSFKGKVKVTGEIQVDGLGMAVVENVQESSTNKGLNNYHTNAASIGSGSFDGANGNIGANVAAGDNNVQGNSAALAEIDSSFAFGSGDAEIFSQQQGVFNGTVNYGSTNSAALAEGAFAGATGNVGVNVAAGNNNIQANNMAASVASGSLSEASVSNVQQSGHNMTLNESVVQNTVENVAVKLTLGATGTTAGTSTLNKPFYPEIWKDDGNHANGDNAELWGHIDFDGQTPSPNDGATAPPESKGKMQFDEVGTVTLAGTVSGELPVFIETVTAYTTNTASISGGAFAGASGNIGVNMAAGTGNLQANNLSLTTINSAGVIISE